jgi:hypothetical protein
MEKIWLFMIAMILISCKKSTEIIEVPVEKKNSWTEVKGFFGTERIFLSSGRSADALYFQQPYYFTEYKPTTITRYAAGLPTDIDIRLPISSRISAMAFSDSILRVFNNANPITSPSGGYFNLKQIDPTLTAIRTRFNSQFKNMAINKNDVLLLHYSSNRTSKPFMLLLMKIKSSPIYPYIDTVFNKSIAIPNMGIEGYVRHIAAIKDYFLVEIPGQGLYKIKEDGTFKRTESLKTINAFYEWQDKIYAHAEWDTYYTSADDGDTWQSFFNFPQFLTTSNFYTVNDSLVGANSDNLYTLKWNSTNYVARFLKNDGLEGAKIYGVEVLKDSVYVATTSGLYVKSIKRFFEGK